MQKKNPFFQMLLDSRKYIYVKYDILCPVILPLNYGVIGLMFVV